MAAVSRDFAVGATRDLRMEGGGPFVVAETTGLLGRRGASLYSIAGSHRRSCELRVFPVARLAGVSAILAVGVLVLVLGARKGLLPGDGPGYIPRASLSSDGVSKFDILEPVVWVLDIFGESPFHFSCPVPPEVLLGAQLLRQGENTLRNFTRSITATPTAWRDIGSAAPVTTPVKQRQLGPTLSIVVADAPPSANVSSAAGGNRSVQGGVYDVVDPSDASIEGCCRSYDRLQWPYQFPQCGHNWCATCWVRSGKAEPAKNQIAGFARAAWAASIAVYTSSSDGWDEWARHILTGTAGRQMVGNIHDGVHERSADLCPGVSDWRPYVFTHTGEDLHMTVWKSSKAKLAIVGFRGTESLRNWVVDTEIATETVSFGDNDSETAQVHYGFYHALELLLPRLRRWVEGYILGWGRVPKDWTLVFTGHSLGGALAILAATMSEIQRWTRKPDAVIVFGAPRVANAALSAWWESRGLCHKLLRVNIFNDVIHWMPFAEQGLSPFLGCILDMKDCFRQASGAGPVSSKYWAHVCPHSEYLVPGASKGVNGELKDYSPFGGFLAHVLNDCLFGYAYGLNVSSVAQRDDPCGSTPAICPW